MSYASATEKGHSHGEAFMLMWYACKDCGHRERLWNSRDGVTPFGITCTSCGGISNHVDWKADEYAPDHKLVAGQRFFRDGTPDEAEAIMRRRVERSRGTPYSPDAPTVRKLIREARSGESHEFQKGWPSISIHQL